MSIGSAWTGLNPSQQQLEQADLNIAVAGTRDAVCMVEGGGKEVSETAMLDAIDLKSVQGPTPVAARDGGIKLMSSAGTATDWKGLQAAARRLGAKTVFFAAADRAYIDLYAGWYIKSILKHCDVPFMVVVHIIGGVDKLRETVKSLGIRDKRVFFAGDTFDADAVATRCYDTPPRGRIAKPVAHLQSVRFLRLGALLQKLRLPVFVSDIDLLLQQGVEDLLDRCAGEDITLNENEISKNAGSRLTANLLLVHPTKNAGVFLRYLRAYLERMLGKPEVTRWIDQFALVMARHHLTLRGKNPKIGYFDTGKDINNVMYPSYQENPFRFLSLYHGFDTSSLEGHAKTLCEPKRAKTAVRRSKCTARNRRSR